MSKKEVSSTTIILIGITVISIAVPLIYGFILHNANESWVLKRGADSEEAKRNLCARKIRMIHLALRQYAMDFSDYFPPANGAAGLEYLRKYDYLADYAVYTCPSTQTAKGKGKQPLTEDIVDYVYVGGLNEKSAQNTPILYDKSGNHQDFGNVGTVDGTVKGISGKDWMKEIRK